MNRYTLFGMILGVAATVGIWLISSAIGERARESSGDGPEVVVQRWLDAARTADVDGMIELTRNPNLRKLINDQRYMIQRLVQEDPSRANAAVGADGAANTPPLGTGFDFRYQMIPERHVIEGDNAAIVVRLTRRGSSVLRQYQLSRRDGMWKVDSYGEPSMRSGGAGDDRDAGVDGENAPADDAASDNAASDNAAREPVDNAPAPDNASRPASNE